MRVLVISHGHPDFAKGGGELAAYNLFEELQRKGIDAYFLAAHKENSLHHGGTPFSMLREKEILFYSQMTDFFLMTPPDRRVVWHDFGSLLDQLQPDVIHFHHFIHLGVQFLRQAATYRETQAKPVKVVYTLHEYIPICANDGQMIMRRTEELCTEYSPPRCAFCLGNRPPEEFFLRERLIRSCLEAVDHFISPSEFLKKTYKNWGLQKPIDVIENGQQPVEKLPPRELAEGEQRTEFTYMGQINRFKGLDVLLGTLEYLSKDRIKSIRINIHGSGLENQSSAFQENIMRLKKNFSRNIFFHGPYRSRDLPNILSRTDTVVMPSIWWENSPLVIQEAFKFGRPIIVSNIGGMAEKVRDQVDGLHFARGSSQDLAKKISAMMDATFWQLCHDSLPTPPSLENTVNELISLYNDLLCTDIVTPKPVYP